MLHHHKIRKAQCVSLNCTISKFEIHYVCTCTFDVQYIFISSSTERILNFVQLLKTNFYDKIEITETEAISKSFKLMKLKVSFQNEINFFIDALSEADLNKEKLLKLKRTHIDNELRTDMDCCNLQEQQKIESMHP